MEPPIPILSHLFAVPFIGFSKEIYPDSIGVPQIYINKMHLKPWTSSVAISIIGKSNWREYFKIIPFDDVNGAVLPYESQVYAKQGDTVLINSTISRFDTSDLVRSR